MSFWTKLGLADRNSQEQVISELQEIIRNQQIHIEMLKENITTLKNKSNSYEEKLEQSIKQIREDLKNNLNLLDNLDTFISSNNQDIQELVTKVLKKQEVSQTTLKKIDKLVKQEIQNGFISATKDLKDLQEMVKLVWVNDLLSDLEKSK
jgi:uncharacterized coiled-coil protein SlyX